MMIPLAEALATRPFPIVVELMASGMKREAQLLEIASNVANIPEVVAGSIPSYAEGKAGQDPLRVGCAVRARGLQPNIHLTCLDRDRAATTETLRHMRALGLLNVFALTGERRDAAGHTPPPDFDSVQLTQMIADVRTSQGTLFHISVAVSPFVYKRDELLEQYLKLERKVAAGADLAITSGGWDARKFAELKRYVDSRGLRIPLLGNVQVLSRREQMVAGNASAVRISPALADLLRRESDAPDGGLQARLERAARLLAVLKGLGYAGAYISGTHAAEHIAEVLHLAARFEPDWERCAEDLQFGEPDGFYLDGPAWSASSGAGGATTAQH